MPLGARDEDVLHIATAEEAKAKPSSRGRATPRMPSASTTSRHPSPVARRRAAPTRAKASMRGLSSSAAANTATTTTSARYYSGGEPPPQQREARRPMPSQLNRSAAPTSTTPPRQQGRTRQPKNQAGASGTWARRQQAQSGRVARRAWLAAEGVARLLVHQVRLNAKAAVRVGAQDM